MSTFRASTQEGPRLHFEPVPKKARSPTRRSGAEHARTMWCIIRLRTEIHDGTMRISRFSTNRQLLSLQETGICLLRGPDTGHSSHGFLDYFPAEAMTVAKAGDPTYANCWQQGRQSGMASARNHPVGSHLPFLL